MEKVKVIDAVMGSGKTEWAIEVLNDMPDNKRFIYITPFLKEIERVKNSVTDREIVEPDRRNSEGRKLRSLKNLVAKGKDIAGTHTLFRSADEELLELLTDSGYTLILDEVMDVVEPPDIEREDIKILLDSGRIKIEENNKVTWTHEDYYKDLKYWDDKKRYRFNDIKLLADANTLFYHRGKFLVWAFPSEVFKVFERVYVLTYLFEAQLQKYYFDLHGIEYKKRAIKPEDGFYYLTDYDPLKENRREFYNLIDIYEGKYNEIGESPRALSITHLKNADIDFLRQLKSNIRNYVRNHCKAKSKDVLWTTLKETSKPLSGKGYAKSFIPFNTRATNEFREKHVLVYAVNRYMRPSERVFFEDNGIAVNQDLLAVSDLLQWVWRSRIREGNPIQLYLPSRRMRELLKDWANYKI